MLSFAQRPDSLINVKKEAVEKKEKICLVRLPKGRKIYEII